MCDDERNRARLAVVQRVATDRRRFSLREAFDAAQFVLGLLRSDAVQHESPLGVVEQSEVFVRLRDGDNIHEAGREVDVGADFRVDLYFTVHDDHHSLLARQS
eukprot:256041_1